MTIHRRDSSFINEAWYEFVQASVTESEIPEMCVLYFTDLADKHGDIMAHADYVRYGQQFYIDSTPTGLYAGRSSLKRIAADGIVATWEHKIRVATTQPEKIGRDPNPLARGVEFIERDSGFRKITSLIDFNNRPVMNRAGDRIGGFEVELPAPVYRYGSNFATIPTWAVDLDGTVNNSEKWLPVRYRADDGSLTTITNFILPAGQAKFRVTQLPLRPTVENNVQFFPINWEWQVSPVGWSEPLLNEGFQEFVYLDVDGNVESNAKVVDGTYHRRIKQVIQGDDGEPVREKALLDWFGRKLKNPTLSDESQGTIGVTKNAYQMNQVTAVFDADWIGMYVKIVPAAPSTNPPFHTTITQVAGGTATFMDPAPYSWSNAHVYFPAISAVNFAAVPYADHSSIPV